MATRSIWPAPAPEQTGAERRAMVALTGPLMPEGAGRQVLAWRMDAWVAHRAPLHRISLVTDRRLAGTAAARAEALAAGCRKPPFGVGS